MLLGLDYLKPRAADEGKVVKASCKSWIKYRDAQRAKFPNTKPDVEPLPPDTAEAQWRKWLARPDALPNLDLEEDELWIVVGYLQLQRKDATKPVQGRPGQGRIDHSGANATCSPCEKDGYSKKGKEKLKEVTEANIGRPANQRCLCVNHATCNGRVGKKGESCVQCQAAPSS